MVGFLNMRVLNRNVKRPALCLKKIISDSEEQAPWGLRTEAGRPPSKVTQVVPAKTSVATTTGVAVTCAVFLKSWIWDIFSERSQRDVQTNRT